MSVRVEDGGHQTRYVEFDDRDGVGHRISVQRVSAQTLSEFVTLIEALLALQPKGGCMTEDMRDIYDALPDNLARQIARNGLLDPFERHARPMTVADLFESYITDALSDYEPTRQRYRAATELAVEQFGEDRLADEIGFAEAASWRDAISEGHDDGASIAMAAWRVFDWGRKVDRINCNPFAQPVPTKHTQREQRKRVVEVPASDSLSRRPADIWAERNTTAESSREHRALTIDFQEAVFAEFDATGAQGELAWIEFLRSRGYFPGFVLQHDHRQHKRDGGNMTWDEFCRSQGMDCFCVGGADDSVQDAEPLRPEMDHSMRNLLDSCETSEWRALLVLVGIGGVDWETVQALQWRHVEWRQDRVRLPGQGRYLPLLPELRHALIDHYNAGDAEEVFVLWRLRRTAPASLDGDMRVIVQRAGIADVLDGDFRSVLEAMQVAAIDRLRETWPGGAVTGEGGHAPGWHWNPSVGAMKELAAPWSAYMPTKLDDYIRANGRAPSSIDDRANLRESSAAQGEDDAPSAPREAPGSRLHDRWERLPTNLRASIEAMLDAWESSATDDDVTDDDKQTYMDGDDD